MRLPRSRRGKTPIDIGIVEQGGGPIRIRVSIGEDWAKPSSKKNSDLDFKETEDLITLLQWHLAKAKGEVKDG